MQWIKTVLAEAFGLFVDDGSFALAIVVWLVLCWRLLPHVDIPHVLKGPILAAGLAVILLVSVIHRARR